jgi:hypothetical protein
MSNENVQNNSCYLEQSGIQKCNEYIVSYF